VPYVLVTGINHPDQHVETLWPPPTP